MIRVVRHPWGHRLYVGGFRVHHGVAGAIAGAICLVARHPRAGAICLAWGASDWRDFPFRDCDNHNRKVS